MINFLRSGNILLWLYRKMSFFLGEVLQKCLWVKYHDGGNLLSHGSAKLKVYLSRERK